MAAGRVCDRVNISRPYFCNQNKASPFYFSASINRLNLGHFLPSDESWQISSPSFFLDFYFFSSPPENTTRIGVGIGGRRRSDPRLLSTELGRNHFWSFFFVKNSSSCPQLCTSSCRLVQSLALMIKGLCALDYFSLKFNEVCGQGYENYYTKELILQLYQQNEH